MMRFALKIVAVLVIGTALGLAVTWATVVRGGWGGAVSDGPWKTSLDTGSSAANMYQRASVAVHGLLALNRSETVYYTANTDSDGAALSGACIYRIDGSDLPTRWWSITAYGADDYLIPNAAGLYSVSMNSVIRGIDRTYSIIVAKNPTAHERATGEFIVDSVKPTPDGFTMHVSDRRGPGSWIPIADGPFSLTLRLYNPGAKVVADPAHVALPAIRKVHCA